MYDPQGFDSSAPLPLREMDGVSSGEGWGGDGAAHRPGSDVVPLSGSGRTPSTYLCYVPRSLAIAYEEAGWEICGPGDDRGYSLIGQWTGVGEPVMPCNHCWTVIKRLGLSSGLWRVTYRCEKCKARRKER